MELRHMNLRSDTAGPSLEFRQRATDTDMEDSVPVRIGMGGKAKSGRRKIKSVSNKPATMSTKKYTPDDQEWPSDLPEHFVDIGKDWRNTPFIIRPAAYQGLLDLCWAVCINRSVESAFNLLDDGREPVRLSAQHLVNGVHKHESGHITHFDGVRDFMKRHGMVPEASCPWTGKVDKELGCTHKHVDEESVYKVNDLVCIENIVEKDLILILQNQPILAVMQYCTGLEDHREGIYDGPGRSTSNTKSAKKMRRSRLHVVEVLGYNTDTAGDTEGKHYWLVQMASGTEWGVNGVGKVMRQISRKEDKSLFVSALYPNVGLRKA
ncbi:unnamed protein product [Brassica napus]|uniref:(rape) hypothetical protein n=1 Tax=Brassica napus TaxID=3708 RepID=A0A816KVH5_BRANA|nr:PREDICTED: tubulointerstitial nephritis antigen-like [Brassica oleracea var. oleracea]XP_013584256.1 PREDICTED: tubulointerstitial nephritis antigen-like [Brassica oleracea var. oleracea]XP_013584257.1 PREDICTED: tubulointerstitial nephritis antigen-like [Brassica oleracea var. oleracea]CAF1925953.1 unnamed protein product [Brassica napus]